MKTALPEGRRAAAGFTLVELMIALVIGLILVLVIAQLFISSRRTFATTDDVARMQENMRFASQIMARTVRQAGFRTSPNTKAGFIFQAPNLVIEGTAGPNENTPDSFTVRFQGSTDPITGNDLGVVNCRGERIAGGVMSTNTFSILVDANGVPNLVCVTNTSAVAQVIVSDVENMKILYGETTNLTDVNPDRFVARGSVSNLDNVVALRVAMLFRSPNTNIGVSIAPTPTNYTLNGQVIKTNDSRLRRDAVFTLSLRNRSP